MSNSGDNGWVTKAEFIQFEKRLDERFDRLENAFSTHVTENKTECKEKRVVITEKIDCQAVKTNKKFKWILYALVVLFLGLVLSRPGSLKTMTGLIIKTPIEQIQK